MINSIRLGRNLTIAVKELCEQEALEGVNKARIYFHCDHRKNKKEQEDCAL